jgi:hypothetical protein
LDSLEDSHSHGTATIVIYCYFHYLSRDDVEMRKEYGGEVDTDDSKTRNKTDNGYGT